MHYEWILWRHAEAAYAASDLERPLTEHGQRQAADTAQWLHNRALDYPCYTSYALRAQQTLSYYNNHYTQLSGLNPDLPFKQAKQALETLKGQNAIIVGHMPWLSWITNELTQASISYHYSTLCHLRCQAGIWKLVDHYRL